MTIKTPGSVLLAAQQAALSHDQRLDTVSLRPVADKVKALPIGPATITRFDVTLTCQNGTPSTVEADIYDPTWAIERSGALDPGGDGRTDALVITIDALRFRYSDGRRRDPNVLTLEFEDEAKALLDEHSKPLSSSRAALTRAEFIETMVREVNVRDLVFYSPEKSIKQPVARPDLPSTRPVGSTGFDSGATFTINKVAADAEQMRNVAEMLGVLDQEGVGGNDRVVLAALVAGIGESNFRKTAVDHVYHTHKGVFQSNQIPATDLAGQTRAFLHGTHGFGQGGAIAYAQDHPSATVGEIAAKVEVSDGQISYYQGFLKEAQTIRGAWQGSTGGRSSDVLTFKSFQFTRGLPGVKETSWDAGTRLANDVHWRLYSLGGIVAFVSDDHLFSQPAALILDFEDADGNWQLPAGLTEMPAYSQHHGKLPTDLTISAIANSWGVVPGEVVAIRNAGPITGRWLVETFTFSLLDASQAQITLVKPAPQLKEPAPEAITTSTDPADTPAGAKRAVAWAKGKVGHYAEEYGSNRGSELDQLEAQFGMSGAPWCAIFATTALVQGGVARECRTAAVADINTWATAGTHGYLGYRATPRAGDLMVFGNDHVGLVIKVDGDAITTIEGNTSAGKVQSVGRLKSTGRFVRPDYAS